MILVNNLVKTFLSHFYSLVHDSAQEIPKSNVNGKEIRNGRGGGELKGGGRGRGN